MAMNSTSKQEKPAVFIGSDIYRDAAFGSHHPLSIQRMGRIMDFCDHLGWLGDEHYRESPQAPVSTLTGFHDADYVEALLHADETGRVEPEVRNRYNIGTMENPVFAGLFRRAATTVGGSMLAARLVMDGGVAYHPAGGTHHGRPDRASGFCYFNDPVFAIRSLLDGGMERVLYADLDAHHGDGVQDALVNESRVRTLSIHEAGKWPYSGAADDTGGGYALNMPVPKGFNDSELDWLMSEIVLPFAENFKPQAVVVTCGADGLAGDPLSGMMLRNSGLWRAVEMLVSLTPRTVVLGGGGYNPWTVVRCWSGLWGRLAGLEFPSRLPRQALDLLAGLESDLVDEEDILDSWLTTLADVPETDPVRPEIHELAAQLQRRM
jgi:acetoin utilization protein AcuC